MSATNGNLGLGVPLVQPGGKDERPTPEDTASLWNTYTFGWMTELIREGNHRELRRQQQATDIEEVPSEQPRALLEQDLFGVRQDDMPEVLSEWAEGAWDEEQQLPQEQQSLRRALIKSFGRTYFVAGCFKFIYDTLQMAGPFVLRKLLHYLQSCKDSGCDAGTGFKWVGVLCLSGFIQTAVLHQYFHRCYRTGMRLNAAAIQLIYRKSLRIAGPGKIVSDTNVVSSNSNVQEGQQQRTCSRWMRRGQQVAQQQTKQQRTSGEIVNLMSVDAQRLQDTMTYMQTLWSGPYQITITLIFLAFVVHWATVAGVVVMVLQVPLVGMVAKRVRAAQKELMKVKDERIKVTNEVFAAVRLIKMYAWEDSFENKLDGIREKELKFLRRYQFLDIVSKAMWQVAPLLTSIATFGVYIVLYGALDAETAFAAMSLFNVLRFPLTMFPNMVSSAIEANLACNRIQNFLSSPEVKGRATTCADQHLMAIRLCNARIRWPGGVPLLKDVSFSVPAPDPKQDRAHLTVVLGAVGAGKSGLLQALIGDLDIVSDPGSVQVNGKIAYSSQVAWIRNATLKNNIIFNSEYDEKRYKEVVKACQLIPDIEALPNGEDTEIGEKGVNLSGGQKQRVSLARAVYANAQILLLDDPLSAVDPHVAKKLMEMLRSPLVRSSSIVLCTHYLGAINHADQVVLLERPEEVEHRRQFIGMYSDVKHPGCPRRIRFKPGSTTEVEIIGHDGDAAAPWTGSGKVDKHRILVDLSAKGGPAALEGKYTGTGICWVRDGAKRIPNDGSDYWPKHIPSFIGTFSDIKHPGCPRTIRFKPGSTTEVEIIGHDGDAAAPWKGSGKVDQERIRVDLSSKGGPSDLEGKYTGTGICWIRNGAETLQSNGNDDWPKAVSPFIGTYSDINHGYPRTIHFKACSTVEVEIKGHDGDEASSWAGSGTVAEDRIFVDLSSKGGPADLEGRYTGTGICWVRNGAETIQSNGSDDWPMNKFSLVTPEAEVGAVAWADVDAEAKTGEGAHDGQVTLANSSIEARVAFPVEGGSGSVDEFFNAYPLRQSDVAEVFSRQDSPGEVEGKTTDSGKKPDSGGLVKAETEQQGAVAWKVYRTYIDAAGGMMFAVFVVGGLLAGQAFQTAADEWVSYWSDHSQKNSAYIPKEKIVTSGEGLLGYVGTTLLSFVGVIGTSAMFRIVALRAAQSFHKRLLTQLLTLPMSFYDTTLIGRVLSRFSKDIYTVDEKLISTLMMYFGVLCRVIATIVVITIATPWFLIIIGPLMVIYRWIQNFYIPSSRQLQRIESNLRSPIFSHFSETLDGVASIRAFGQQEQFNTEIMGRVERNMKAYYLQVSSNRWLAVRLETIGTAIVTAAGVLEVFARNSLTAGMAGVSVSYALSVTQSLNWVVRMTSDRETSIVSVERLDEYIQQKSEPERRLPRDPPERDWPSSGKIEFANVHLRYRPGLPLVLKGLNLEVIAGEKLGICGRTGAGKSSLLNVLLRIVDPSEGTIKIDGQGIAEIGVHRLRRSITVLPQDPVLFSGSLRFNLDPLVESGDDAVWQALCKSHLAKHVQALALSGTETSQAGGSDPPPRSLPSIKDCLASVVAEKGENFSLGQRQQMCLARALLRSNKILLLDEATSAVDKETDDLIQQTIRTDFSKQTVLCIAHRISTVMACDRVCVVDAGKVAEIEPPQKLLDKPKSLFAQYAKNDASR